MPTITAGQTFSQYMGSGESITVQLAHNSAARMRMVPDNDEAPAQISGNSRSMGPLAENRTFGPWAQPGTVTLFCDVGSLTYTLVAAQFNVIDINGGTVDATPVGATTPSTGSFTSLRATSLQAALTDGSGTPGNVTQNVAHGRAAFAAAASTVVVTNSQVAANSTVLVSLGGADATLTSVRVTTAAGSFTVTGNAAATGTTPFDYIVIQN